MAKTPRIRWRWSRTTRQIEIRSGWTELLGYPEDSARITFEEWARLLHPGDHALVLAMLERLDGDLYPGEQAVSFRIQDAHQCWVGLLCFCRAQRDQTGQATGLRGTMQVLSDTPGIAHIALAAETDAANIRGVLESTDRLARLGRWDVYTDGRRPHWSPVMYAVHDVDDAEPITMELMDGFYINAWSERVGSAARSSKQASEEFGFESLITTRRGSRRWVAIRGETVLDDEGMVVSLRGAARDVTEEHRLRTQLQEQADMDALTGLLNRACFMSTVQQNLAELKTRGASASVLLIDLNEFKEINDTMGHDAGDRFLQEVAERLRQIIGPADVLARMGGDEFAVFSPHTELTGTGIELARAIGAGLKEPFWPEGIQYFCSGSIGVAHYPAQGSTPQELLRHADVAMYAAKDDSAQGVREYHPSMTWKATVQLDRRAHLERAVQGQQFELHFQPRLSLATMKPVGIEALVRWRDSRGVLIPPSAFVGLAERTGLIHPIGQWVIDQAISAAATLADVGLGGLSVAINLSPRQFRHPELIIMIESSLARWGVAPTAIEVEITENALMDDSAQTQAHLRRLHELGVAIALDDFGTGYSNFAYLQELQLQAIKLDRRFITRLGSNPRNARLVEAMLSMARSLRLRSVAEGVETAETLEFLRERGCDELQGFLCSPALPMNELLPMLRTFRDSDPGQGHEANDDGTRR